MDVPEDKENGFGYDLHLDGEEDLIRQCLARTKDHFTFFDVGANRGDWTNFVISNCTTSYSGHLFEISKVMRQRLRERIYPTEGNLIVFNDFGLSDAVTINEFRRFVGAEGVNTLLTQADYWENDLPSVIEETQLMDGDTYCANAGVEYIDLLKIDTEGWELNVLKGFLGMFSEWQIKVAQFEYGYLNGENHTVARDFWRLLEPMGYTLGRLHKNGIDLSPFRYPYNNFTSGPNFVALSPDAMKDVL
jgi:FkbM family methyltransferase